MKRVISNFIKIFLMTCYFILAIVLIIEACIPGGQSAAQSGSIADKIINTLPSDTLGEQKSPVKAEKIELTIDGTVFYAGGGIQTSVKLYPEDVSNKIIEYSTSDNSIATVSNYGYVTFKKEGTVIVRAKAQGTDIIDEKELTVSTPSLSKLSINCSYEGITETSEPQIKVGQEINLSVSGTPHTALMENIVWESSNPDILTLNLVRDNEKKITVTGVKAGKSTITVKTSTGHKKSINITVVDEAAYIEDIRIDMSMADDQNVVNMNEGDNFKILYDLFPSNISNQALLFTSSNGNVAVDNNGNVHAVAGGSAVVTIYSAFDKSINAQLKFKIKSKTPEIKIVDDIEEKGYLEIEVYTSFKIQETMIVENRPSSSQIVYGTDNDKILTVTNTGIINAISGGTTNIYIQCKNPDGTSSIKKIKVVVRDYYQENKASFFFRIRKGLGHFLAFTVFAIFGALFFITCFKYKYLLMMVSLLIGLWVAGLTEYIQTIVPGRYGVLDDVLIDFSGYALGTVIIYLIYSIYIIIKFLVNHIKRGVKNAKE